MAATMLHKEYGLTQDVMVGAGIGILSTDAGVYFSYPFTARWRIESKLVMGAQYSSGATATAYFPDQGTGKLKGIDIFKIHEFHSFGIGTGLAHTYIVHRNFSIKLFTDYDFIPTHLAFTLCKPEGNRRYKTTKPTHLLTLGASININFKPTGSLSVKYRILHPISGKSPIPCADDESLPASYVLSPTSDR